MQQCIQPCTRIKCIKLQTQKLNTCTPIVSSDHTAEILSKSQAPTQNIETNVAKSSELLQCNVIINMPVPSICRKSGPTPDSIADKKERTDHEHEGNRTDIEIQIDIHSKESKYRTTCHNDLWHCPTMVESKRGSCPKLDLICQWWIPMQ